MLDGSHNGHDAAGGKTSRWDPSYTVFLQSFGNESVFLELERQCWDCEDGKDNQQVLPLPND